MVYFDCVERNMGHRGGVRWFHGRDFARLKRQRWGNWGRGGGGWESTTSSERKRLSQIEIRTSLDFCVKPLPAMQVVVHARVGSPAAGAWRLFVFQSSSSAGRLGDCFTRHRRRPQPPPPPRPLPQPQLRRPPQQQPPRARRSISRRLHPPFPAPPVSHLHSPAGPS